MSDYQHILVAIDLTEEAPEVLRKAKHLAESNSATLELLHVVEPVGYAYGGDLPLDLSDLQQQLEDNARSKLDEYGDEFGVSPGNRRVVVGRPGSEVRRQAEEHGSDLIVIGSHGRHGIQLLLGSTANSVLHGSPCDVLAVRIGG
ncbi:universal stress protein [Vreelandella utahensis]|uniref:universal stress protein n=1 Tax=Vreelandella halophila TaxID=86177 RepID=UPI0009844475|nr:universal stress protein [Halomonas utahensis]